MTLAPSLKRSFLSLFTVLLFCAAGCSSENVENSTAPKKEIPLWGDAPFTRPACIKGVHLTAWFAGNKKARGKIDQLLADTELNTVVIAVKEIQGDVYIPIPGIGYSSRTFVNAIPDIKDYLQFLKERGVWTVARIVVFKDSRLPKDKPEWAVQTSTPLPKAIEKGFAPNVWVDHKGLAWADPYNPHVWKYNIDIAARAIDLGFQEIQWDYIRFPSDGKVNWARYSKPHSPAAAAQALAKFLERGHERLKPKGAESSIDVFGLVGSDTGGMGIGQKLSEMMNHVEAVSPMMYPSHYAPGELGVKDPNNQPYDMVYVSIRDTQRVMAKAQKPVALRPYLQDFSLGVKYTAKHVRDQIQAANDLGVYEWLLWSPSCRYTREALLPKGADSVPAATPAEEPAEEN
jgi:hypothetical protein